MSVKHRLELDDTCNKKKTEDLSLRLNINEAYSQSDFMSSLSDSFTQKTKNSFENGAKIIKDPFTCCVLPDFIAPEDFVDQLKTEVEEIDVELQLSDLYQFKQSTDLATLSTPDISHLKKLFNGKLLEWMKEITKIPLSDRVDMSCSCYTYTDHLLCHDDELEGRRIAYIYYLVSDWNEKYGGTLDLFNMVDDKPSEIVHSFVPEWNSLIFFEVGPSSYHQVSEILAYKTRTSISGWFYGPPLKRNHSKEEILFELPTTVSVDIENWINQTYLQPETQIHIRESFEESSEIELMEFLQGEKYEEVCKALMDATVQWKQKGPPSHRKYGEIADFSQVSPVLRDCQALFASEAFLLILSNLTGLRLHPECSDDCSQMGETNSSIRRWSPGSYSLLHEQTFLKFATLNAGLCFNCKGWEIDYGGYTSYVAKDEKEELLRVDPKPNSLALVYITEGTSNFVKYVNSRATEHSASGFQDIFSVYKETE